MSCDNLPLISVIITCYNIRGYVTDAFRSVCAQSHHCLEIIIVDDGSTDDTRSLVAEFLQDERVKYLFKENGGPSSARNFGIAQAQGEYLAFLDGDDLWEPEKLAHQVAVLQKNPGVGMVFCDFSTFDAQGTLAARKNASLYRDLQPVHYDYLVSRSNFIYPSTVMVRRIVFLSCGAFDEALRGPEDYDMWLRIVREFVVIGMHEALVRIRQHPSNLSKNIKAMIANETAAIEKQRLFLARGALRRRMAKLYLLNADRSIHANDRKQAVALLLQGLGRYPFLPVDVSIVLVKLVLGGGTVERLRRLLNGNPLARRLFEVVYQRY
jgi:glycosyltransferase involved in cell wall biosynthesis